MLNAQDTPVICSPTLEAVTKMSTLYKLWPATGVMVVVFRVRTAAAASRPCVNTMLNTATKTARFMVAFPCKIPHPNSLAVSLMPRTRRQVNTTCRVQICRLVPDNN